jgi:hypothetical protein
MIEKWANDAGSIRSFGGKRAIIAFLGRQNWIRAQWNVILMGRCFKAWMRSRHRDNYFPKGSLRYII